LHFADLDRITVNPEVMAVSHAFVECVSPLALLWLDAEGHSTEEILKEYPYWKKVIFTVLTVASMRVNEIDVPLTAA